VWAVDDALSFSYIFFSSMVYVLSSLPRELICGRWPLACVRAGVRTSLALALARLAQAALRSVGFTFIF
jgi:hypothetical protein